MEGFEPSTCRLFSTRVLEATCAALAGRRVAALLVCGGGGAAAAVVTAAARAGVPVLRTSPSHLHLSYTIANDMLPFEIRLEITARETLHALRATLLHTHWHTFTLLAEEDIYSSLYLRKDLSSILTTQPLNPIWLSLPTKYSRHAIFRRLAEVSRLTRGVVVLISDIHYAKLVMDEAKRLNMLDGHFFWLWLDASSEFDVFQNIVNSTQYTEDRRDSASFSYKEASLYDSFERNNKSVESSKIENLLEKEDVSTFHVNNMNKDNIEATSRSKTENESFNNDISDFLLNPTVHTSTTNNVRDKLVKRMDKYLMNDEKTVDENKGDIKKLKENRSSVFNDLPVGLLALYPQPMIIDETFIKSAVRLTVSALYRVLRACDAWSAQAQFLSDAAASCWEEPSDAAADFSIEFVREMRVLSAAALAGGFGRQDTSLTATFSFLNLILNPEGGNVWRQVGHIRGRDVHLHTIVWPGGRLVAHGQSAGARTIFRIVTALAPPFVMEGELDEDGQCLRGLACHRPQTSDRDNLTLVFNVLERENDQDSNDFFFPTPKPTTFSRMATHCCYGFAMDLLENIAQELEFDFHLYIVEDGLYGSRKLVKPFQRAVDKNTENAFWSKHKNSRLHNKDDDSEADVNEDRQSTKEDLEKWNGIIGDLVSGAAHMSFAALSVSAARAEVVDFSQPYFFSGISILAAPNQRPDIPLLAFLLPFSPELWIAIFTSLNVTAIAVAIYEWLSPFGLNPWGRQRSKNFSISSALWVMWGLLCGHLVAFKAPKSWPNKFLINVWGGFSVIFVASYTANIAALIAGLFFHNAVDDYQGRSNWLSLRIGTAKSSAAEYYVQRNNPHLAEIMRRYALQDIEEGIQRLRNGTLDLLIADTPVLDYYRATDHGCKLQKVGEHALAKDTYAIGMAKGFPLKDSISAVIAKYSSNGYMDILTEKWYGALPCFKLSSDYGIQPKPLGVAAVAGVFILLGVGMIVGCLILILEHLFYKYTLPILRHQPKGTIWRSRNIMFFSQKLYRFINCVELVSPHHAARELVNTIRQGHFTSLFQKSVKRKEHEQRRRRKSKAQFFEMIQEIRRVQQCRDHSLDSIKENVAIETSEVSEEVTESKFLSPSPDVSSRSPRQGRSPRQLRSPKSRRKRCSVAGLNVRRFSTDSVLGSDSASIYERTSLNIGRRLSRDVSCLTNSPPDINTRLRTPSPMARRVEGSSTRSYQDVSERSNNYLNIDVPTHRASIEIMVSQEHDLPPAPPYPKVSHSGGNSQLSQLSEDELIRLWRSSEREIREALLAALQERRANLDPKQDPG
ncbi:Glutamate [NMDA] receptor subunit 3A [Papilio xuthus]|uniref:Glutamate [NMDA] receptor subunit 3A n=1 Tax=Papilio xuthus TaxID=66420 RepID=A0A194PYK8_PAPXU|nr:Glutamate [NMDA] receptor subunit 3A [Papilio xuthus]